MSRSNPFGNLGQRDWGLSFWLAILTLAGAFVVVKLLAFGLTLVLFPAGILLGWLAVPIAAAAGETLYHYRTGMQTYGLQRAAVCLLGTLPAYLLTLVVFDAGLFSLIFGWPVSACAAGFWMFVLDKLRNNQYF